MFPAIFQKKLLKNPILFTSQNPSLKLKALELQQERRKKTITSWSLIT